MYGELVVSPLKKRPKRNHLSKAEKQTVVNLYKHETAVDEESALDEITHRVAAIAGVSARTVYAVLRAYKANGHEVSAPLPRTHRTKSVLDFVDDADKSAIRRKIHNFYFRHEIPTLDKVLIAVNNDPELPTFTRSTFWKVLKQLKFRWQKRGRKSVLLERDDLVIWRRKYLKEVKRYRGEGRPIFYLDETWINAGHTTGKVWIDTALTTARAAFLEGLTTGPKNPSGKFVYRLRYSLLMFTLLAGKGKRLIVCHIGSANGFVPDALWAFESRKTGDYHEEMTGPSFETWFEKTLTSLPDGAVIVLDNASYHSRQVEKIPNTSSTRAVIIEWLTNHGIEFDAPSMVKTELLALVKAHRERFSAKIVDQLATAAGKTVLRLAPYHCELNPIELIWAQIKNNVASKNTTFKFADMKALFEEAIAQVTAENWRKCIEHVKKVEAKMWELDHIVEVHIEPLIIALGNDSGSEELSSDSDSD